MAFAFALEQNYSHFAPEQAMKPRNILLLNITSCVHKYAPYEMACNHTCMLICIPIVSQ